MWDVVIAILEDIELLAVVPIIAIMTTEGIL